jgi:HK97 family phage prohead protease
MDYDVKSAPLSVKAAGPDDGLDDGQFIAYASVFGNQDSYGDIVDPGAFARTLGEWGEKGETIPVLWGHDMSDPFANIGAALSAEEDERGLKITGALDLDNPTAAQVYRLLKGRRTNRMSFAYSVRDAEKGQDGYHLKDLDLYEVSIVQVPANEQAEVLAVKDAADALRGRTIKSVELVDSLRKAQETIGAAIAVAEGENQGEASGEPDAKSDASDEESDRVKSSAEDEEPNANPSVDSNLAATVNLLATAS